LANQQNLTHPFPPPTLGHIQQGIQMLFARGWLHQPRGDHNLAFKVQPLQLEYLPWTKICRPAPDSGLYCHQLRVIHLVREDFFAGALSFYEAQTLERWHVTRTGPLTTEAVTIPNAEIPGFAASMTERCLMVELGRQDLLAAEKLGYLRPLELKSPDLISDDLARHQLTFEQLGRFLGLDHDDTNASLTSQRALQRMKDSLAHRTTFNKEGRHTLPYQRRVKNFASFCAQLQPLLRDTVRNFQHPQIDRYYDPKQITNAKLKCELALLREMAILPTSEANREVKKPLKKISLKRFHRKS
jgi:hypothetical protein